MIVMMLFIVHLLTPIFSTLTTQILLNIYQDYCMHDHLRNSEKTLLSVRAHLL